MEVNILQVNKLFAEDDLYLLGNLAGGLSALKGAADFIFMSLAKAQSRNNALYSVYRWCV